MKGNKTILGSILVISLVSIILAGSYTGAFFFDTETSEGNTFTAGTLNLQVGDADPVTWSLDENVMPGDSDGENINVENTGTIDGFLHINFTNLLNNDITCTEPEEIAEEGDCGNDPNAGELAENLSITVYFDNDDSTNFSIGDTLIYQGMVNNTTTSLLQAKLVDSELLEAGTENFRIDWQIDGAVGNEVQSDSVQFDIPFELTQNPKTVLNGLVGYWTLNEKGNTTYDYSGNENTGVINGATLTNGKSGGALSFDGVDDYVETGVTGFDSPTFTATVWAKGPGVSQSNTRIINYGDSTANNGGFIIGEDTDGVVRAYVDQGGGNWNQFFSDAGLIDDGNWHFLVITYDGTTAKLFVDNVKENSATSDYDSAPTNPVFTIGRECRGGEVWEGNVDEVHVYNRALTAEEIKQNFNAGN